MRAPPGTRRLVHRTPMKSPAPSPRVTVFCRPGELSARIEKQLARDPGFDVSFVGSMDLNLDRALRTDADVIVVDAGSLAPKGFEVYRVLQPRSAMTPLLVFRAHASSRGGGRRWVRAEGVEALETRLHKALGRRADRPTSVPLTFAGAHLHARFPETVVAVDGVPIELSFKEADLLGLLLSAVNRVLSREVLIAEIWGYETRSLDVYIRRLRRKLGPAGTQIETLNGLGYRFVEPPGDGPGTGPNAKERPFVTQR